MNKSILLTEKFKEKNMYVNNLLENINKISIEKSNIEVEYKSLLETKHILENKNQSLKETLNKEYEKYKILKTQLDNKINENEIFKLKIEENNISNKNLNNIIDKLQNNAITTMENIKIEHITEIKNIKKQLVESENKIKNLYDINKNLELENNKVKESLEKSQNHIFSNLRNKYDTEVLTIKQQLEEKQQNFEYIKNYSKKLEASLRELETENSSIKEQLEGSKNKGFFEKFLK